MSLIIKEGYELNEHSVKRHLLHCFNFDHFSPECGIAFLVGVIPSDQNVKYLLDWGSDEEDINFLTTSISLINEEKIGGGLRGEWGEPLLPEEIEDDDESKYLEESADRFSRLVNQGGVLFQYWNSGKHPESTPPLYFIEWALSKNFRPVWLNSAIEFGLYKSAPAANAYPNATDKPLATTERNTLLTIIAALCDNSKPKILHQERGAAAQIARLTEASETPVSEDAISKALKKIPDALERRMK